MVCLLAPCWWPLIPNLLLHPIYSQINVCEALPAYLNLCLPDFRALLVSPLPGWGTWCSEKPSYQPGVAQLRNPGFFATSAHTLGLPRWHSGKESACQHGRCGFDPWIRKILWRRKWQPSPVFLPGKFRGQRSLAGYSPWGCTELDRTEHTRLCILSPPFSFFWLLFLLKFYLFIYFWLCWVFTAACGRL